MKTIEKVSIEPVFVEYMPEEMEQGKVYISDEYQVSIHLCLCGCGEETIMSLMANQWSYTNTEKGVSFTPSVGNYQFACKSHYIITNSIANFV